MKGVVEVYKIFDDGSEKLMLSEDNLIVDGAAESIVDFLTMSPDLAYEVTATNGVATRTLKERVLDASNYIIQGFTTGKGLLNYKENAHKYKKHNLITSAGKIGTVGGFKYSKGFLQVENKGVSPLDLSSDALRIIAFNNTKSSWIEFSGLSGQVPETNAAMDFDYLKTLYRAPLIFSVDLKLDYQNLPQKTVAEPGANPQPPVGRRITIIRLNHHGTEVSGAIQWSDTLGKAFILEHPTISQSNIMLKELGSGWYRAAVMAPSGTVEAVTANSFASNISCRIFPAGDNGVGYYGDGMEPSGGVIISRPSLNVGSVPVNYFLGEEPILRRSNDEGTWPVIASSLPTYFFSQANQNRVQGPYMLNGRGTLRVSTSSYDPIMSLPAVQNPILSGLEPGAKTSYEDNIEIDIQTDHNMNVAGFIGKPRNLAEFLGPEWSVGTSIKQSSMTTDSRWLGCYNEGATVKYFLVESPYVSSYQDPVKDSQGAGTTNGTQRTADLLGYIRTKYESLGELDGLTTVAQRNPWLKCFTANSDEANGYVEYEITLGKFDITDLNIHGGVTQIGLYTLDFFEMLRNNHNYNSAINKNVDSGDDMKFKLFSRKVFNESVTAISDNPDPTLLDNQAGIRAHSNLRIVWGIQF